MHLKMCVCGGGIKKTRRVAGSVIRFIMITRGDVQRVINAFILEETLY